MKTTPSSFTTATCAWWIPNGRNSNGSRVRDYLDYIAEHVESWSYLKFPYYRRLGWPAGTYRVGPLGRLNAAKRMATPLAQQEYVQFQQAARRQSRRRQPLLSLRPVDREPCMPSNGSSNC